MPKREEIRYKHEPEIQSKVLHPKIHQMRRGPFAPPFPARDVTHKVKVRIPAPSEILITSENNTLTRKKRNKSHEMFMSKIDHNKINHAAGVVPPTDRHRMEMKFESFHQQ